MLRSEVWLGDTQERLFHQSLLLLFSPDLWHPNHAQSLSVLPHPHPCLYAYYPFFLQCLPSSQAGELQLVPLEPAQMLFSLQSFL